MIKSVGNIHDLLRGVWIIRAQAIYIATVVEVLSES